MAENTENSGCLQRDSAEHAGYAKVRRSFNRIQKERDSAQLKEKLIKKSKQDDFTTVKEKRVRPIKLSEKMV